MKIISDMIYKVIILFNKDTFLTQRRQYPNYWFFIIKCYFTYIIK